MADEYYAAERSETPPNPSIVIPFSRDRDFVERKGILDQIHQSCSRPGSRTALVGLGGVGKSQLAIEYAYRTRERFPKTWVFWVHASNAARFEQSFRDIANCVKTFGRQNPKANILQLMHDWLCDATKGPWVLILDNVDDAGFLKSSSLSIEAQATETESVNTRQLVSYLPHCQHGSVLITSRSRSAASELVEDADIITIEPMVEVDAVKLFQNKLGQQGADHHTAELAAALEHMPLAIVQAAAYISQRWPRRSVRQYLDEFRRSDSKKAGLLGYEGGKLRRDPEAKNSILITWQLSFDYIRQIRPSAADMLSLMSFCDRQGIPEIILRNQDCRKNNQQKQEVQSWIKDTDDRDSYDNADTDKDKDSESDSAEVQSNNGESDRFEDDILTLRNYSFIFVNEDRATLEMHRLVQLATLECLEAHGVQDQWRYRFLKKLSAELPTGEYENWAKCQALFPHAQSVAFRAPKTPDSLREWATVLYKGAWYALRIGRGAEAEDLSVRAMKARKKIFNMEHEDVVDALAMVALAYGLRGRWDAAKELEVQVMETRKKTLGEDHPDTLNSMANLASTYRDQGQWDTAEELQVQVMETRKKKLGEDHPNTLNSMANLASTYRNQGRWDTAADLEVQVMETRKKKLGEDHPDTLNSMANLASTYRNQGRWDTAADLEVQVMETSKKKLGEDHPDTLIYTAGLASTLWFQGQWEAAEELQVQVMESFKKKFGEDHPDTLACMANLAATYNKQGRWDMAEELKLQVIEARKKKLGKDHPDTLISMANLAVTYGNRGRWAAAEELQVQVIEARRKKLGEDHPDTLNSMANLALTYRNQGQWDTAKELEVQLIKIRKKKLEKTIPAC